MAISTVEDFVNNVANLIENSHKGHAKDAVRNICVEAMKGFIVSHLHETERILCAAIWYKDLPTQTHKCINQDKGIVVTGLRHGHCIDIMSKLGKLRSVWFGPDCTGENEQGFLTSKNRFVNRTEAYQIALNAYQISKDKTIHSDRLFSEDLY